MESSTLQSYHADLSLHPLFKGLKREEFAVLQQYYQIFRVPVAADFLFPGESADSLYIVLSGSVRSGKKKFYKGDFWGLENLLLPDLRTECVQTGEETILFRLKSGNFRKMLRDHKGFSKHFKPVRDRENHLLQGIPDQSWKSIRKFSARQSKTGDIIHYKSRSSKKTFSLMLIIPAAMIIAGLVLMEFRAYFLLLVLSGMMITGCEIFLRKLTLYKVTDKAVIKRFFNWRFFRQDQEIIPVDQIQTVTITTKHLINKILRIGDLQIQTAGKGVLFERIDAPLKLQTMLMALKQRSSSEEKSRDRDALRELISKKFTPETADELLYAGEFSRMKEEKLADKRIFRKSPAIIVAQLFWPLSFSAAVLILPSLFIIEYHNILKGLQYSAAGIGLLRSLWLFIDWWNDIYMINLPHIWDIERKPLGKEDIRKQTELSLVLNVTASQNGLFPLLMNYGDVVIETAGRGEPLVFFSVRGPFNVQNELLLYRDYSLRMQEQKKRERAKEDLIEFTEILDQSRQRVKK